MNYKAGNLKNFVLLSIVAHMLLFSFFPMSLLNWKDTSFPSGEEFSSFYLVEYEEYVEPIEEELEPPKPVQEVTKPLEEEKIEKEETIEETKAEEKEYEAVIENPLVEETLEDTSENEELVEVENPEEYFEEEVETIIEKEVEIEAAEEQAVQEDLIEEIVDSEAPAIITSEHSDEIINLPIVEAELEENDEEAAPENAEEMPSVRESLEEIEEIEELLVEVEEEPPVQEPQLPSDPSLMVVEKLTPVLPKNAANEGREGKTVIYVHVTEKGTIDRLEKLISSGDPRIDDVAERTVIQGWQFHSFHKPYTIQLEIDFKLQQVDIKFINIFFTEDGA